MTREEAIKSIKLFFKGINIALSNKTKEALGVLIPELAESEDEKIRKEIIGYLNSRISTAEETELLYFKRWIAYLEKQKEQKPVKLDDDTEVGLDRALQIVKDAKGNLCGYQSDDGIYECDHAIQTLERILKNGIEQKPAEKQDYSGLNYLERAIHRGFLAAGVENVPVGIIKETAKDCLAQMKPAEWSEEDEKMLNEICANLYALPETREKWQRFLKSLRPSWKPSEQEKGALQTAIYVLTEERTFPKTAAQLQNILNAFEGKESRKDWKPSEAQMDRLFSIIAALRKDYCDDMADFLANLRADLKKLGVKEEPEYYQHFDPDC